MPPPLIQGTSSRLAALVHCSSNIATRFLAVIGGEMDGEVLDSMKTLDLETNEWRMQAQTLRTPRKDHACVATR